MANTTIEIKYSQVSGNTPSSLANGEISINTADGKLFYKAPSGTITPFAKYPGPAGLNGEIQFNDSGTLGSTANLSIIKANGSVVIGGTVKAAGATNEAAFMSVGSNGRGGAGYHTFLEANNTSSASGLKSFRINNAGQLEIINSAYSATILSLTDAGVLTAPGLATSGYVQFSDGSRQYTANAGTGGSGVSSVAGATGAISNTQLINAVTSTNQITFNSIVTSNNGQGTNFRIGDDAWLGDVNVADTVRLAGLQNSANGWLRFGSTGTEALGRAGAGPLLWGANTIWHSGNGGTGSGLDADLLDGLTGTSYANAAFAQAGFTAANTAQTTASAGFTAANTAQTPASAGFTAANTAQTTASAGFTAANTAQTTAAAAFNAANTAQTTATNALSNTVQVLTVNSATRIVVANTTATTSNTTGALIVSGGLGVVGNVYTGNHVITGSTSNGIVFVDGTIQTTAAFGATIEANTTVAKILANSVYTIGNSKSYTLTTGGRTFMDVFVDGNKLTRNLDYTENTTTAIVTSISIPIGSVVEFRIEK